MTATVHSRAATREAEQWSYDRRRMTELEN